MVVGFDFDGTLVQSFTATPLPLVRERLHTLPPGTRTFLATNQGEPAWRAVTEDAKYPTVARVAENIIAGMGLWALDWQPDLILVCTYPGKEGDEWERAAHQAAVDLKRMLKGLRAVVLPDRDWRKPAPGMLLQAADMFKVQPAEIVYVGDMESDEAAARAAGARFRWAEAWRESGLL